MKHLILSTLLSFALASTAQYNSYSDNEEFVTGIFDLTFIDQETEFSDKIVLSALDDYGVKLYAGPFKTITNVLDNAFKDANCINCKQVTEYITDSPLNYIFGIIKYRDVFLITEFENQYKVIRYQPKEED